MRPKSEGKRSPAIRPYCLLDRLSAVKARHIYRYVNMGRRDIPMASSPGEESWIEALGHGLANSDSHPGDCRRRHNDAPGIGRPPKTRCRTICLPAFSPHASRKKPENMARFNFSTDAAFALHFPKPFRQERRADEQFRGRSRDVGYRTNEPRPSKTS